MIGKADGDSIEFLERAMEKGRTQLPAGFFEYTEYSQAQIERGRWPSQWNERAGGAAKLPGTVFARAVLEELRVLLCTSDKKYDDVRRSGKSFAKIATTAVAGFVAGRFGIELAVASSAAAAGLLLVVRVGSESFCRASSERPK